MMNAAAFVVAFVVAFGALLSASTPASATARHARRRVTQAHPPVAVLTVSRSRTMLGETHLWDYASALFIDSTRGVPEAGYWRVPAGEIRLSSPTQSLGAEEISAVLIRLTSHALRRWDC